MEANTAAKRKGNTSNTSITSTAAAWSCSPVPGGGEPILRPVRSSVNQHKREEDTKVEKEPFKAFHLERTKDTRSREN